MATRWSDEFGEDSDGNDYIKSRQSNNAIYVARKDDPRERIFVRSDARVVARSNSEDDEAEYAYVSKRNSQHRDEPTKERVSRAYRVVKERDVSPEHVWVGRTKAEVREDNRIIARRMAEREPPASMDGRMVWAISDIYEPERLTVAALRDEKGSWKKFKNGTWYFKRA